MQKHDLLNYMPFVIGLIDGKVSLNSARIFEAVIIAIIAGGFSAYISIGQLKTEFINHKDAEKELSNVYREEVRKLDLKMSKIEEVVYKLALRGN